MQDMPSLDEHPPLLAAECAALAAHVGALLKASPLQHTQPLSDACLEHYVSNLTRLLSSLVAHARKRVRDELAQGRRALSISLDASLASSSLTLAARACDITDLAERLTVWRTHTASVFAGYVLLRAGEQRQVLYPPVQAALEAIEQAFSTARTTTEGAFIVAESPDGLSRVMLQRGYPSYYVYELVTRAAEGGAWTFVERTGRDQLVALLAAAYANGCWFVTQEGASWTPCC